jgi:hypothetical protein
MAYQHASQCNTVDPVLQAQGHSPDTCQIDIGIVNYYINATDDCLPYYSTPQLLNNPQPLTLMSRVCRIYNGIVAAFGLMPNNTILIKTINHPDENV